MWGPEKQTGGEHGSKWGLCGYRCSEDAAAVTPVWSLAKAGPGAGSPETSKVEPTGLEQSVKA